MIFHIKECISLLTVHGRDAVFSDSYPKVRKIHINAKKTTPEIMMQSISKQQPTLFRAIFIAYYYVRHPLSSYN